MPVGGAHQLEGAFKIDDFREFKRGDRITIFRARQSHGEIVWVHDRIEYDAIWGSINLPDGVVLPPNSYLYDNGFGVSFASGFGYKSNDGGEWVGFPGGFELNGGYAYRRAPQLSQYSRRWDPSESKRSSLRKFNLSEERGIERFVRRYEELGFKMGTYIGTRWNFTRVPLPGSAEFKLGRGEMEVHIVFRKGAAGLFRSSWSAVVSDQSRRCEKYRATGSDVNVGSTTIIAEGNLPDLSSALGYIEKAIDFVAERNRVAEKVDKVEL